MDLNLIFAVGSAVVSAAFSAGMAFTTIRVIGDSVEKLSKKLEKFDEKHDEHGATLGEHEADLAVLKDRTQRIERRLSPWEGHKRQ